ACFAEEFGGEPHVGGAVDAPEPKLLLVALEKVEGLLEFLHGTIEGRSEEEHAQSPGMTGVTSVNANAILPVLVFFDAAAIVVAYSGDSSGHRHRTLREKKLLLRCADRRVGSSEAGQTRETGAEPGLKRTQIG